MYEIEPRESLVKKGTYAIGGIGGGIALLVLNGIGGVGSLIVGGVLAALGIGLSTKKDDRNAGLITAGAGILTAATAIPILGNIAGFLLGASGVGLLAVGGINLFKFIKGYRQRTR